jgi:phosphatidylinositol glycan class U
MVLFPYLVAVPALARFGDRRPALALFLALVAADAFGAYPTLGSLAGALGFLPLFSVSPTARGSRPPLESSTAAPGFVVAALFAFAIVLAPIFWRLWIETRAANANFFFGACLAYFAARAALAVETARRAIANDRAIKYGNGGDGRAGEARGIGEGGMKTE